MCYAVEAGRAAELLQAKDRDEATVHRLRGDVLLWLKQDALAAQEEYRKAIALRPGDPASLARLAEAQSAGGDTEAAKRSAQAALAIDPHRPDLRTLAFPRHEQPRLRPGIAVAAAACERVNRMTTPCRWNLASALAQTGQNAEALHLSRSPRSTAGYPDEKGALHALEARVLREWGVTTRRKKASAEARRLSRRFSEREAKANGKENKMPTSRRDVLRDVSALAAGALWEPMPLTGVGPVCSRPPFRSQPFA